MANWYAQFSRAGKQTKYFILVAISLGLLTLVTLVWSYIHTAFARSAVRSHYVPAEEPSSGPDVTVIPVPTPKLLPKS